MVVQDSAQLPCGKEMKDHVEAKENPTSGHFPTLGQAVDPSAKLAEMREGHSIAFSHGWRHRKPREPGCRFLPERVECPLSGESGESPDANDARSTAALFPTEPVGGVDQLG